MDYFFDLIKLIGSFYLLLLLPGLLYLSLLKGNVSQLDNYEKFSLGLVISMAMWIPISWVSFGFGLSGNLPIYISLIVTIGLLIWRTIYCKPVFFKNLTFNKSWFGFLNIFVVIVLAQSIFVGLTAQYHTSNSDAFVHLAGIRNLVSGTVISSCDQLFGPGSPMGTTYGCNPWYLALAMVIKTSSVNAATSYNVLTGIIFFTSVLAVYTLFKSISGNISTSKFGAIIFTVLMLMIWLIGNKNTTYNLSMHWIMFPQAIVSYVLFPTLLASFIKYIHKREKTDLFLVFISFLAVSRFHPNWLLWAPIIITGLVIGRSFFIEKYHLKSKINYKFIIGITVISALSLGSFIFCVNTFSSSSNLIAPLDLWRVSGGNLLVLTDNIFLYDPLTYLRNRGLFDIMTILLLWYLNSKKVYGSNETLIFFITFLGTIFLIIFNPLFVVPFIKLIGTPIPIYRVFELMWPSLSVVTIYAVLTFADLKSKYLPRLKYILLTTALIFSSLFFAKYTTFLIGVYQNEGEYYDEEKSPPYFSTVQSPKIEPFLTLRSLGNGKIAVRTPLATVIAALTDLDPITTEWFRYSSSEDRKIREEENIALLTFNLSREKLVSILKNRHIRYILIDSLDESAIIRFKAHPNLIKFKTLAGKYQIWEVNSTL